MSLTYKRLKTTECLLILVATSGEAGNVIVPLVLKEGIQAVQAMDMLYHGDFSAIDFDSDLSVDFTITDDNYESIIWGPSLDGDNWCRHFKVSGNLSYTENLSSDNFPDVFVHYSSSNPDDVRSKTKSSFYGWFPPHRTYNNGRYSNTCTSANANLVAANNVDERTGEVRSYVTCERAHDLTYVITRYDPQMRPKSTTTYTVNVRRQVLPVTVVKESGYSTLFLQDRYSRLVGHAAAVLQTCPLPGDREFVASQEAALSYNAYDLNLIEAVVDLKGGLKSQLPAEAADNICRLVENSKFTSLPSKVLDAAKILANTYLYNKYVALPTASDVSQLTGVDSSQEHVDRHLQILAEQLVYKGTKEVTRYGSSSGQLHDGAVGTINWKTNARVRAYPKFLKDMSDAAIIVDNIGLSLSAERLTEVIPYEFVANWFLPIEDSVRAIEYNDARLNSMWQISGICLSDTVRCGEGNLPLLYGLGSFTGNLSFTWYSRSTRMYFPSTRLPAVSPLSINPSRVMQGASLIISQ